MESGYDNVFPKLPDVPKFDPNDLNKADGKHVGFAVLDQDKSTGSDTDTDVSTNIMLTGKGLKSSPNDCQTQAPSSVMFGELPGYVLYIKGDDSTLKMFKTYDELSEYLVNASAHKVVPGDFETHLCMSDILDTPLKHIAHHTIMGEYLRRLYTSDLLMDVKIEVNNEIMMAHRIALCCYSDYLADLFYKSNRTRLPFSLRINGVSAEAFAVFLEFVYTGDLAVTPTTATDLLLIADFLQVKALQKRRHLLLENLPLEQIVKVVAYQQKSLPRYIYEKFIGHILHLFSEAVQTKYFLQIDVETLCKILASDELIISSEFQVYKVAVDWLFYDLNPRFKYAERVLQLIRYCYMTQDELFRCVEMTALVRDNGQYHGMFTTANWILTANILGRPEPFRFPVPPPRKCNKFGFSKKQGTNIPFLKPATQPPVTPPPPPSPDSASVFFPPPLMTSTPVASPPTPKMTNFTPPPKLTNKPVAKPVMIPSNMQRMSSPIPKSVDILVVGGFPTDHGTITDPNASTKDQWVHYCQLPEPMQRHAVTVMSGKLYLIGGFNPTQLKDAPVPSRQTFSMNIGDKQWERKANMIEARYNHCACSLNGKVYAIGGQGLNNRILSSVECYIPQADMWAYVHFMNVPRYAGSVGCLGNKLYVVGGLGESADNMTHSPVLKDVEVFDPTQNYWKVKKSLRFPRCNASLVNVNDKLYLCGGASASYGSSSSALVSVASIDEYVEYQDAWSHRTDMVTPRHDAGVAVAGPRIYIIGGYSSTTNEVLQSIECFDTRQNVWLSGLRELPLPSRHICCVSVVSEWRKMNPNDTM